MLTTPFGNRIDRPLRMAVVWGLTSLGVAVVLALLVGSVGWLVSAIGSLFGDGTAEWPEGLVRNVGAAVAPFTIASSTWAAAFLSTERMPAGRALLATALAVVVLIVLARIESPAVLFAASGLGWGLAIPVERWSRMGARVVPVAIASLAIHFTLLGTVEGNPLWPWVIIVGLSVPTAALVLWPADLMWVKASVRQDAKGDEG